MATRMSALPLILALTAVPSHAFGQYHVCYTVQPSDTAARVARRLTGDAENVNQPWFQIIDTATRTFQPKTAYDLIRPGWQVCLPKERVTTGITLQSYLIPASVTPRPVHSERSAIWTVNVDPIWWVAALLINALLAGLLAKRDLDTQRVVRGRLQTLGNEFIREFERPLAREPARGHPLRSQLQVTPHRGRLDILLAPNGRRTYPNLSDHRKNLEYDVERVLQHLGGELCTNGEPYARGAWVVIPFRLKAAVKQRGVM
jgi:hypothetical protein